MHITTTVINIIINISIYSDNGKVPSVVNTLAIQDGEPYKPRANTSHQISHTVKPYMMTNVGNSEGFDLNSHPLDLPNSYGQLEPKQMSNADDRSISQEVSDVHSLQLQQGRQKRGSWGG